MQKQDSMTGKKRRSKRRKIVYGKWRSTIPTKMGLEHDSDNFNILVTCMYIHSGFGGELFG